MRAFAEGIINTLYSRKDERVKFYAQRYEAGGLAIQLTCSSVEFGEEPFMTATFNPISPLAPDEVAIKDWSENGGIYDELVRLEIIEMSHRQIQAGMAVGLVCRLTPQAKELIRLVEAEEKAKEAHFASS